MIEVRIPKEIREYKTKYFFGLTLRQTITTATALLICVPLYVWGSNYIEEELLSWLILLIAIPLMLMGWFTFNQMTFERFVVVWFRMQWNKQKRPYQELPIYSTIREQYLRDQDSEILERLKTKKNTKNKREKTNIKNEKSE